MDKLEALASIMSYFNGDTVSVADMLSDAYSDEPYDELADEIDEIKSEIGDETELHEWLLTLPVNMIGYLAREFADMFELCHKHSADPEVCGCRGMFHDV